MFAASRWMGRGGGGPEGATVPSVLNLWLRRLRRESTELAQSYYKGAPGFILDSRHWKALRIIRLPARR